MTIETNTVIKNTGNLFSELERSIAILEKNIKILTEESKRKSKHKKAGIPTQQQEQFTSSTRNSAPPEKMIDT